MKPYIVKDVSLQFFGPVFIIIFSYYLGPRLNISLPDQPKRVAILQLFLQDILDKVLFSTVLLPIVHTTA